MLNLFLPQSLKSNLLKDLGCCAAAVLCRWLVWLSLEFLFYFFIFLFLLDRSSSSLFLCFCFSKCRLISFLPPAATEKSDRQILQNACWVPFLELVMQGNSMLYSFLKLTGRLSFLSRSFFGSIFAKINATKSELKAHRCWQWVICQILHV